MIKGIELINKVKNIMVGVQNITNGLIYIV